MTSFSTALRIGSGRGERLVSLVVLTALFLLV